MAPKSYWPGDSLGPCFEDPLAGEEPMTRAEAAEEFNLVFNNFEDPDQTRMRTIRTSDDEDQLFGDWDPQGCEQVRDEANATELETLRKARRDMCEVYVKFEEAKAEFRKTAATEDRAKVVQAKKDGKETQIRVDADPVVQKHNSGLAMRDWVQALGWNDSFDVRESTTKSKGQDPYLEVQGDWKPTVRADPVEVFQRRTKS